MTERTQAKCGQEADSKPQKKTCPIMHRHCLRDDCAWWSKGYRMCFEIVEAHIAGVKWSYEQ